MNSERISPFWVNGYQPFSAPLSYPFWRIFFCHSVLVGLLFRSKGHLPENSAYFKKSKLYFLKSKPYFLKSVLISEKFISETDERKKARIRL